jgi:hypothetical protein
LQTKKPRNFVCLFVSFLVLPLPKIFPLDSIFFILVLTATYYKVQYLSRPIHVIISKPFDVAELVFSNKSLFNFCRRFSAGFVLPYSTTVITFTVNWFSSVYLLRADIILMSVPLATDSVESVSEGRSTFSRKSLLCSTILLP